MEIERRKFLVVTAVDLANKGLMESRSQISDNEFLQLSGIRTGRTERRVVTK